MRHYASPPQVSHPNLTYKPWLTSWDFCCKAVCEKTFGPGRVWSEHSWLSLPGLSHREVIALNAVLGTCEVCRTGFAAHGVISDLCFFCFLAGFVRLCVDQAAQLAVKFELSRFVSLLEFLLFCCC